MQAQISRRLAFTMVEVTICMAMVAVVGVIVAQAIVWTVYERHRATSRHAALELAVNVLEAARAEPFGKLDADWAKSQRVPDEVAGMLPNGSLAITIEPDPKLPAAKHVSVEVRWGGSAEQSPRAVRLGTIISARERTAKGGTP